MADLAAPAKPQRLTSLDAFRGMTIASMLLVNNPGSWEHMYWPLDHAIWNGWTFTDLIFPFFLYIMGVAMVFSFGKRLETGEGRAHLFGHVIRRALSLMLLGYVGASGFFLPPSSRLVIPFVDKSEPMRFGESWSFIGTDATILRIGCMLLVLAVIVLLAGTVKPKRWIGVLIVGIALAVFGGIQVGNNDPLWGRLMTCRWPGVLVRIGVCYLLASSLIFWNQSPRFILAWIVSLLAIYWVWSCYIPIPGYGTPDLSIAVETEETESGFSGVVSNWGVYLDMRVFGMHNYQNIPPRSEIANGATQTWGFDPEGFLSTLGALCTVLCGYLNGLWLRRQDKTQEQKTLGMFVAGNWLLIAGLVMSIWFPINKKIWTSSYVVFMAGMALVIFGMTYYTMDVKGKKRLLMPFVWFGTNAITAFYFSGLMAVFMGRIKITVPKDGVDTLVGLNTHIYEDLLVPHMSELNASLVFAVSFVLIWTAITGILYRLKIFLKI